jgi:hypothetical protein
MSRLLPPEWLSSPRPRSFRRRPAVDALEGRVLLSGGPPSQVWPTAPAAIQASNLHVTGPGQGVKIYGIFTNGTRTTVSGSPSPATYGQEVTFTAVVSRFQSSEVPTGAVVFTIDGVAQPEVSLQLVQGTDQAIFRTSTLSVGDHEIDATYKGDSFFAGSTGTTTLMVLPAPSATTLTAAPQHVVERQSIRLTAQVHGSGPSGPAGSITFLEGSTPLGTAALGAPSAGTAAGALGVTLSPGTHVITAQYDGDPNYGASSSSTTVVVTTTGPGPVPVDGPHIVSLQRQGIHHQPTTLVLTFDAALDPATATDLRNYVLTGPAPSRAVIPIAWACYDASHHSVTLRPAKRLNVHSWFRYQLTVRGSQAGGVADASGHLLDGTHDGQAGGDVVLSVRGFGLGASAR